MADEPLVPPAGSDDDAKIWADLVAAEEADAGAIENVNEAEPVADTTGADITAAPAAKPGAQTAGDDIWKDAPETYRTAAEALRKERDDALVRERRAANSIPAQTRKVNELLAENERLRKASPPAGESLKSILEDPELQKAREDYPEVIKPVEKVIAALEKRAEAAERKLDERFSSLDQRDQDHFEAEQAARLTELHPDWQEVAKSSQFKEWKKVQPPMVQQAIDNSIDAAEVSLVLSLYKQSIAPKPGTPNQPSSGKPADRRTLQLESATAPRGKGPAIVNNGPPDDDEGIWKYYAEQDRKKAQAKR